MQLKNKIKTVFKSPGQGLSDASKIGILKIRRTILYIKMLYLLGNSAATTPAAVQPTTATTFGNPGEDPKVTLRGLHGPAQAP